MEIVNSFMNSGSFTKFSKGLVLNFLKNFQRGQMTLILPNDESLVLGDGIGPKAQIKVNHSKFFARCLLYGDVGFGESFVEGEWSTPDLKEVIRWAIANREDSGLLSGSEKKDFKFNLMSTANKVKHKLNRNSKDGSKKNISYHYDLSNELYKKMLDPYMCYSCGVFENQDSTLDQAQEAKLKRICEDLELGPDDHVLEIGCGWGSFAVYAVKNYGCRVTGVTISNEQAKYAKQWVKDLGLEDSIEILVKDYRDITEVYDKVVSIEMIEAVGDEFLGGYFQKISDCLSPEGVAVIQAITCPDDRYEEFKNGVDFIQKHIFPGSLLPSVRAINQGLEKTGMHLYNLRDIGLHYAKTLREWKKAVDAQRGEISQLGFDDKFFRMWDYYLCYCDAAFSERNISTVQLTLIKANNTQYKTI